MCKLCALLLPLAVGMLLMLQPAAHVATRLELVIAGFLGPDVLLFACAVVEVSKLILMSPMSDLRILPAWSACTELVRAWRFHKMQ